MKEKCKYKIIRQYVIKEEIEELNEKPLRRPSNGKLIY